MVASQAPVTPEWKNTLTEKYETNQTRYAHTYQAYHMIRSWSKSHIRHDKRYVKKIYPTLIPSSLCPTTSVQFHVQRSRFDAAFVKPHISFGQCSAIVCCAVRSKCVFGIPWYMLWICILFGLFQYVALFYFFCFPSSFVLLGIGLFYLVFSILLCSIVKCLVLYWSVLLHVLFLYFEVFGIFFLLFFLGVGLNKS